MPKDLKLENLGDQRGVSCDPPKNSIMENNIISCCGLIKYI